MSGTTVLKGFKEVVEGQFTAETGYIYFVHKTTEKRYILLNGKKYGENILRFIDSGSTTGGGVTIEEVIAAIDDAMDIETARTETTYLKEHQSLDDYATKEYVDAAMAEETARTETTYLKEHQSLDDYATKEYVNDAISGISTSAETQALIDAAMAEETARTETTYLKEHQSLDGYYTSAQTEDKFAQETARTEATYLKEHQSLADYYTSAQTDSAIANAIATETARTETTYLKEHQSLVDYYTSAQTDSAISEAVEELTEIIDKDGEIIAQAFALETARTETTYFKREEIADYYTSAQTNSAITSSIATAMTNVVTSTTITTIVCCTQQEYDNMQTHPSDTLYVINNN